MKRTEDDSDASRSQENPPLGSPLNEQPPGWIADENSSLIYIMEIKEKVEEEKYFRFLEIMTDFKANRMDANGVRGEVKELLKGHNDLILKFNKYLPPGYEIVLDDADEDAQSSTTN